MPSSTISRGNIILQMLLGPSLTPTALTASTTTSQTFTVLGLQTNDSVTVNFNGAQTAGVGIANAYVSAANVLTVVFSNSTAGTPTPAAGIYVIALDRAEYQPLPVNAL
jgi:hypothetical protein